MRMAGLFKRGYEAAREEKKKQDERREMLGKRLFRFFLKGDGDEARVRFLTEEPVNFEEHNIKSVKGGKETYTSVLCSNKNCPYCADGDKPSFKGAFLVYDYTPFEVKDEKTGKKKKVKGSTKLYVAGSTVLAQLDRISQKYGLTDRDYDITRSGKGTSTSYIIERTDDVEPLSESDIEKMLPDKLREEYDGTDDSLYSIVEGQLEMYLPSKSKIDDEEDEDDEDDEEYESRKNLVHYDDDDEDEDDEDDEEEKPTRRRKVVKKSSVKGMFKKNR